MPGSNAWCVCSLAWGKVSRYPRTNRRRLLKLSAVLKITLKKRALYICRSNKSSRRSDTLPKGEKVIHNMRVIHFSLTNRLPRLRGFVAWRTWQGLWLANRGRFQQPVASRACFDDPFGFQRICRLAFAERSLNWTSEALAVSGALGQSHH